MTHESLLRVIESLPGCILVGLGVFCLSALAIDTILNGDFGARTILFAFGSLVFVCLGIFHTRGAMRGEQQILNRNPHPGPKVIIDDDGVDFTDRDQG